MSSTVKPELVSAASVLPAEPIVARIRRLLITSGIAVLGYTMLTTSSKGHCAGGMNADGEFLDAAGRVTEAAPNCISLTLQPSGLIYIAIFVIIVSSLSTAMRRAIDVTSALRYLDRTANIVIIVAVASIVISQVWFWMIPITDWNGSGAFFFPFPFGAVDLDTSPMVTR